MTTVDELIAEGRFSMWHLMSKGDMMIDYPEMRKYPAFTAIKGAKLLFVWFYACRCSRAMELPNKKDRIKYAMRATWGDKIPKDVQETFPEERWGNAMHTAIDTMRAFQPGPRMMLKLVASQQIEKVKRLLDADIGDLAEWSEKLEFIKASKAGTELIASLQPLTEHTVLGIVEKTEEQETEEESQIGQILSEIEDEE